MSANFLRLGWVALVAVVAGLFGPGVTAAWAKVDLVVDGKPNAVIFAANPVVVEPEVVEVDEETGQPKPKPRRVPKETIGANVAAETLANWIEKMSGARLEIVKEMPKSGNVILIGQPAIDAGLKLDGIKSESNEGLRIKTEGNRILIAGQDQTSTLRAACRLLEELGCRYTMDHPLGEIYPTTKNVTVPDLDMTEKPVLNMRKIWGSSWSGNQLWKVWNGAGGIPYVHSHSWTGFIDKKYFETNPEYFALRDGARKIGSWYCTSNPEVRKFFVEAIKRELKNNGGKAASLSPPDGVGYCQCDKCNAQDDPKSIEPSSGRVATTNRYVDLFNHVAREVAKEYPDASLGFYAYADYTVPPTNGQRLEKNLVVFMAPIRFCRVHQMGSQQCESRQQLLKDMKTWGEVADQVGYRTYNAHLAEISMPFSFLGVWEHDIPFLHKHHTVGINFETLPAWQIYGPHLYQSIRLAYDPTIDSKAMMKDYFEKMYGPAAGTMAEYWQTLDDVRETRPIHTGCFFGMHNFYTPEIVAKLDGLLTKAAQQAGSDEAIKARVQMNREGFKNAVDYLAVREATNAGDIDKAMSEYDALLARATDQKAAKYGIDYTLRYLERFVGNNTKAAYRATRGDNKVKMVMPDQMKYIADYENQGEAKGYTKPDFNDSAWRTVKTYSDTIVTQGYPEDKTWQWYRTTFDLPKDFKGKPELFFIEVDGVADVYINGKRVGGSLVLAEGQPPRKRIAFPVDISSAVKPGKNSLVVKVDHTGITELALGGIIRPIYLIDRVTPAEEPPAKAPAAAPARRQAPAPAPAPAPAVKK